MKPQWALRLELAAADQLGALRLWPGLEVLEFENALWLRAEHLDEAQWEYCRRLSGAARYVVHDDGQLTAADRQVPRGYLPQGDWQRLDTWLVPRLPPPSFSAATWESVPITVVRSTEWREPTWLLTTLDSWADYVATAPQARLARWSFVADAADRVIVRGAPLPPLPGVRLVEQDGIAVPGGWTWSPAIEAAVLRDVLRLAKGDTAVWDANDGWQTIAAGDWVQASRSAVRLTREDVHGDR